MTTATVVKEIGSGATYSTPALWEAAAPADLTATKRYAVGTFVGAGSFTQDEAITCVGSGATGFMCDTDGSTYMILRDVTGTPLVADVFTGATKSCVCTNSTPTATEIIWEGQVKSASDTFSSSGTTLTMAGSTDSATAYKHFTTKAGASFRDNASVQSNALRSNSSNGCIISNTGAYSGASVVMTEPFCRMTGQQVTANSGSGAGSNRCLTTAADTQIINFCILEGYGSAAGIVGCTGGTFKNSLMVARHASAHSIVEALSNAAINIYNSTLAVPSNVTAAGAALFRNYNVFTLKNVAIFGCTLVDGGNFGSVSATTCYTDVASPPTGFTQITYNTSLFQNITDATRDYRLPSGSGLIDVGTTDTTNAAIDIAGTARPSGSAYDVGCWEYVSGGGGGGGLSIPVAMNQYRQRWN